MISDHAARQSALQIDKSFIVQAPAGSGKTGLLVYRMLALLACAERPEQVLAITFTRKATSEMRQRLLELLQLAERNHNSEDAFEQQGIDLAKQVLLQDAKCEWSLLNTPHQLQILTIDSFCGKLTGQLPWLSRLGDNPRTSDQADQHYAAAVEQLFNELLGEPSALSQDLQTVMLELDFNYARARRLFSAMLVRRDQWLRHLLQNDLQTMRTVIQQSWQQVRDQHQADLQQLLPAPTLQGLTNIALKAASLIDHSADNKSPLAGFESFQIDDSLGFEQWLGLRNLLLTTTGGYRKTVNKNIGFPTSEPEHKKTMIALLQELADDEALRIALEQVKYLPAQQFSDADWQQLIALENVLKSLAGLLQLRFRSAGECDHSEVTQRANMALQELDNPTDLALRLDYQINHILVDEFQDTSHAQLQLLKRLTIGWDWHDQQRSLFLVGDPMQSVYRFREADVGLFLQVADNKRSQVFDNIEIEYLRLTENFRSNNELVSWFNQTFASSFPQQDQVLNGAISYAAATSNQDSANPSDPSLVLQLASTGQQESQLVVAAIKQALQTLPSGAQVAVLVRSRSHLKTILPAIQQAGIAYSGVDIQALQEAQAVIDVLALCKAICRLDDRVSWLALLRGPWCGLTLSQIQVIAGQMDTPVWQQLEQLDPTLIPAFDAHAIRRMQRFCKTMRLALAQRQQVGLHSITRWAWQALGGDQTLYGLSIDDIYAVFDLIEQNQQGGDLISISGLDRALEGLYARPQQISNTRVVVSTMHKAKGLQYDTVILPSLAKPPRADQKDILMWAEHQNEAGDSSLLLAPIRSGNSSESHYEFLRRLEQTRAANEAIRLMYVACTRAERKLILLANVRVDDKTHTLKPPNKNSLLATVWDVLQDDFELVANIERHDNDENEQAISQTLSRLPSAFEASYAPPIAWQSEHQLQAQIEQNDNQDHVEFEWATEVATAVGIVMHEWLQFNHNKLSSDQLDQQSLSLIRSQWRAQLMSLRVPAKKLDVAMQRLNNGLDAMRGDKNAHFLFAHHSNEKNEYAISAYENGLVNQYRIDRTFVDQEGTRWIIDYKTTYTRTEDVDRFIDEQIEQRHRAQLQKYASLICQIDDRPIKLAVYFPMLARLRSWDYQG